MESKEEIDFAKLQKSLQTLQHENVAIKEQSTNLNKYNSTLQEQVGKYAMLLSEEKSERKELIVKYDTMQNTLQNKVEKLTMRFYFLFGIAVIMLAILILQFAPILQSRFSK